MSDGQSNDAVTVKGFYLDHERPVWIKTITPSIERLPGWFEMFLYLCTSVEIMQEPGYTSWEMEVTLGENLGINFPTKAVNLQMIGGDYSLSGGIKFLDDSFTLDDSGSFSIPLVEGTVAVGRDMNLGRYPKVKVSGGFTFTAVATLLVGDGSDIRVVGSVCLGGEVTISFDYPFAGIPFVGVVGVTGGVSAGAGIEFSVMELATDGVSFAPDGHAIIYLKIGGHAGMYLQILGGLGRFEGGLEASGTYYCRVPDLANRLALYGGAYAKVSALWGLWSRRWSYGVTWDSGWSRSTGNPHVLSTLQMLDQSDLLTDDTVHFIEMMNVDIPSLKQYDRDNHRSSHDELMLSSDNHSSFNLELRDSLRGEQVLATNVGGYAVPKIVLTSQGEGIAVWSDISKSSDGLQSDIYWSVYDGTNWGLIESTNTSDRCEFNPEIILVDNGTTESVVLTYLVVDEIINSSTNITAFYNNVTIHTAVWNKIDGWSFTGENLFLDEKDGTVNTMSLHSIDTGTIFMSYLTDTNSNPWETGTGSIYVVNGSIMDDGSGPYVHWSEAKKIHMVPTETMAIDYQPRIGFVNDTIGVVVLHRVNQSLGQNETVIFPTVSGIKGFSLENEIVINRSRQGISYTQVRVDDRNLSVFWVENNSRICETIIKTATEVDTWKVIEPIILYEDITDGTVLSVTSLKVVGSNDSQYLLFQQEKKFTPFILEKLPDQSWGNLRQISIKESYSTAQIDGDSNNNQSKMIYLRDSSLANWLIGRWRCNEGENTTVTDDSIHQNHGSLVGNIQWIDLEPENSTRDPIYGPGIYFYDDNSYVNILYHESMVIKDEFTVTLWVNITNITGYSDILGVDGSWKLYQQDGDFGITLWRSNEKIDQSTIAPISNDTWTFIGVTYLHGSLQVIIRSNDYKSTSAVFDLGDDYINNSGNPLKMGGFVGGMDDVWLFNRDISMSEVDSIWFTPYPILGSIHDVVVQKMPSYLEILISVNGIPISEVNATTKDIIDYTGSPSEFIFEWDFGDDKTDNGSMVSHQYDTPGYYTVICYATDPSIGVVTPLTKKIFVGLIDPDDDDDDDDEQDFSRRRGVIVQRPIAVATVDKNTGVPGEEFTFDASMSYHPQGVEIVQYHWDFDDGTIISTNETIITHLFDSVGVYSVMLTVEDDNGETGSLDEPLVIKIIQANNPPEITEVTPETTWTHKQTDVLFTIRAFDPDVNDTLRFKIDWGDGEEFISDQIYESNETFTISHHWDSFGVYMVTVSAYDQANASSDMKRITMHVDVIVIDDVITGWLIDLDSDGMFDVFRNLTTKLDTNLSKYNESTYLIDSNGDGEWDYYYNIETGLLTAYSTEKPTDPEEDGSLVAILILAGLIIFLFIIFVYIAYKDKQDQKKREQQKKKDKMKPEEKKPSSSSKDKKVSSSSNVKKSSSKKKASLKKKK